MSSCNSSSGQFNICTCEVETDTICDTEICVHLKVHEIMTGGFREASNLCPSESRVVL
jgi:hypothetical protein